MICPWKEKIVLLLYDLTLKRKNVYVAARFVLNSAKFLHHVVYTWYLIRRRSLNVTVISLFPAMAAAVKIMAKMLH